MPKRHLDSDYGAVLPLSAGIGHEANRQRIEQSQIELHEILVIARTNAAFIHGKLSDQVSLLTSVEAIDLVKVGIHLDDCICQVTAQFKYLVSLVSDNEEDWQLANRNAFAQIVDILSVLRQAGQQLTDFQTKQRRGQLKHGYLDELAEALLNIRDQFQTVLE